MTIAALEIFSSPAVLTVVEVAPAPQVVEIVVPGRQGPPGPMGPAGATTMAEDPVAWYILSKI